MASDAILGFRTVTRMSLYRQAIVSGTPVLIPIGIPAPPSELTIDAGEDIQEIETVGCDGAKEIAFSYSGGRKPEMNINFSTVTIDLEAAIFGRVAATVPAGTEIQAFAEFNSEITATTARPVGKLGTTVVAQTATSKAKAWYLDPTTKKAQPLTIVPVAAGGPTGPNEVSIDAALVVTVSPDVVAQKVNVQVWCPCVVPNAVGISSEAIAQFTVEALGINFDGKARHIRARNLSRLGGAQTGSKPERTMKLRINPDSASFSGLGYDVTDLPVAMAC
jgi:hypothetical protein